VKRTGTFFAPTAAVIRNMYIFRLGQKADYNPNLGLSSVIFACVGHTKLGMRYDNLSSELQINGR